jgi:phenylacetate-CoA ligase
MVPRLAQLLDPAIAALTRRHYPARLRELRAMEGWPREEVLAFQRRKLAAVLGYARENVPYWRETLRSLGGTPEELARPEAFSRIPFLSKDVIRERERELVDQRPRSGRVGKGSTSGSTGINTVFRVDMDTYDRRRAAARLVDEWEGVRPGTRVVSLWGSPLDAKRSRLARLYDRLANRLFLSAYALDDERLERYARLMEEFRPEALVSYPSILLHSARRLGRERCRALALRRVFTEAEALYPTVRAELEDLFGCPVRNRYGCREFGTMAAQCQVSDCLHVVDSRILVESVAIDGGPPELVVTDLDNRVQPFIRYRILDSARILDDPCPCGRPFTRLAAVDGRSLDVVVTPRGKAFGGTFFTIALRPWDAAVEQLQVVQEAANRIRVRIVPGKAWGPSTESEILARLRREMDEMEFQLEQVREIPPLASGKRRYVVGYDRPR